MKKVFAAVGAVILACALFAGGYIAGQKVQMSSIASATPRETGGMVEEGENIQSEEEETESSQPPKEEAPSEIETREISASSASSADETWTVVDHAYNAAGLGTVTLYTSAQKSDGEIIWDDGQKWIVEVSDGNGEYFTLYDQYVSNGSVYYEVVQKDSGDMIINVYTVTGTGTTIKQYTSSDTGYSEKTIYDSGAVNRLYSTFQSYR
ncbi:MAG: hypothetical protein LUF26_03910 [Firmicutes bacterium]|nr:hypothetical protein [Bacillota bacterium]